MAITGGVATSASASVAFAALGPSAPEPRFCILARRVRMLRAVWHEREKSREDVDRLLQGYANYAHAGTVHGGECVQSHAC
eukprot:8149942-Alexandrium_andersonii.AAC.1